MLSRMFKNTSAKSSKFPRGCPRFQEYEMMIFGDFWKSELRFLVTFEVRSSILSILLSSVNLKTISRRKDYVLEVIFYPRSRLFECCVFGVRLGALFSPFFLFRFRMPDVSSREVFWFIFGMPAPLQNVMRNLYEMVRKCYSSLCFRRFCKIADVLQTEQIMNPNEVSEIAKSRLQCNKQTWNSIEKNNRKQQICHSVVFLRCCGCLDYRCIWGRTSPKNNIWKNDEQKVRKKGFKEFVRAVGPLKETWWLLSNRQGWIGHAMSAWRHGGG